MPLANRQIQNKIPYFVLIISVDAVAVLEYAFKHVLLALNRFCILSSFVVITGDRYL